MQAAPIILGVDMSIADRDPEVRGAGERPLFLELAPAPHLAEGLRA